MVRNIPFLVLLGLLGLAGTSWGQEGDHEITLFTEAIEGQIFNYGGVDRDALRMQVQFGCLWVRTNEDRSTGFSHCTKTSPPQPIPIGRDGRFSIEPQPWRWLKHQDYEPTDARLGLYVELLLGQQRLHLFSYNFGHHLDLSRTLQQEAEELRTRAEEWKKYGDSLIDPLVTTDWRSKARDLLHGVKNQIEEVAQKMEGIRGEVEGQMRKELAEISIYRLGSAQMNFALAYDGSGVRKESLEFAGKPMLEVEVEVAFLEGRHAMATVWGTLQNPKDFQTFHRRRPLTMLRQELPEITMVMSGNPGVHPDVRLMTALFMSGSSHPTRACIPDPFPLARIATRVELGTEYPPEHAGLQLEESDFMAMREELLATCLDERNLCRPDCALQLRESIRWEEMVRPLVSPEWGE